MADPMRIRAVVKDETVEVKILISHVMESGQRRDIDGNVVPAHYIEKITATCNGRIVLSANWGPSVSKNPYLSFRFKGANAGDMIVISWSDTEGDTRTDAITIR